MSNPKRASMREGPLAALFRKTEEAQGTDPDQPAAPQDHDLGDDHGDGLGEPDVRLRAEVDDVPATEQRPAAEDGPFVQRPGAPRSARPRRSAPSAATRRRPQAFPTRP